MPRNRTFLRALVLALLLLPASALLIDDFEASDFSITDTSSALIPPPARFPGVLSRVHPGSCETFANL